MTIHHTKQIMDDVYSVKYNDEILHSGTDERESVLALRKHIKIISEKIH